MKQMFQTIILIVFLALAGNYAKGQNSVLVNFGSRTCVNPDSSYFHFIKDPLTATPAVMAGCKMANQVGSFFGVFIAYNPKNNKIYVADVKTFTDTKIWVLDIGLPGMVTCPASIPLTPSYTYSYVSNNFEFDNNGDLWSFSGYDDVKGVVNIDKFDVSNGNVINTRVCKFPAGHFPESITSGDLTILPNGRMFATLGQNPSQLYEITGYTGTDTAQANYLQTLPFNLNCYGIAYLNGRLEITGTNLFNACYYFEYDIASNTLVSLNNFQNGLGPIDNSSFTPAIGTTKQLISATKINATTADLVYEIYVQNMGNVILNNINVTDDLEATFGVGNVSNVSASFVTGFNNGNLTINPSYNGTSQKQILNVNQQLPNNTSKNNDYYFKLQIQCRVTNLQNNVTYLNSAIGTAFINNQVEAINVSDSSNNGPQTVIDPNNDGNASGIGENVPTPFNLSLLPVKFLNINASFYNKNSSNVEWKIATPTSNALRFEVEFSRDARAWQKLGSIDIVDDRRGAYQFRHLDIPAGNLYYRIKQIDKDGFFIYSSVVLLQNNKGTTRYIVYPNPAKNYIGISAPVNVSGTSIIEVYDAIGRLQLQQEIGAGTSQVDVSNLITGYYLLKIKNGRQVHAEKILVMH